MSVATLHMLCGKIAAGKSTLAARLAAEAGSVLIAEDVWLAELFGAEMQVPADYMRCAARLRGVMGPHVTRLLTQGLSVVLDFQANTAASRGWLRELVQTSGAAHQLHVLAPPDEVCLARLRARNAAGTHPFQVTEAQFHQISRHFSLPSPEEGFNLVWHATE